MPAKLITPRQEARIAELCACVARNAAQVALEALQLESAVAQDEIIMKGGEFQALIRQDLVASITRALNNLSGRKHPGAEDLELYFQQVYGLNLDLTSVQFPERDGMPCYMVEPRVLDEDQICDRLTAHFKVKSYLWKTPIAGNINRGAEQKRPSGLYAFAHVGGDEPDAKHLGKSYDDAVKQGLMFLNAREYLLVTGFHMWKHKKLMDEKGWTRTSSLWSDGDVVDGYWDPRSTRLYLDRGNRGNRLPDAGVRELFLG